MIRIAKEGRPEANSGNGDGGRWKGGIWKRRWRWTGTRWKGG